MSTIQERIYNISDSVQKNTAITSIIPGTKIHQLIEAVAAQNIELETQINDYTKKNSIATATGRDLENIGEGLFGIYRTPAVAPYTSESMKAIKFYVKIGTFGDINRDTNNQGQPIIIPEGTTIEGSYGGSYYKLRVVAQYVLAADASEQYVSTQLVQGDYGSIPSNIMTYHSFSTYTQGQSKMLLVTNPIGISTGRKVETDQEYRYRISKAIKIFPKTTQAGIYDIVRTVPGVSDAIVYSAPSGGGTVTIYVQGTTPITADEVISDVEMKLRDSVPPWCTYNVVKPFCVGLTMYLTINVTSISEYVRSLIVDNISAYVNNFYGDKFLVNRIANIANSSHDSINFVTIDKISTYVGSTEFREIAEEIDYSDPNNPAIYLRATDKLIIEPISNAIQINFVA